MSDQWDNAYKKIMESGMGFYNPARTFLEADPYPQQGGAPQQQAPEQGGGMGDMNQEQPPEQGGEPQRTEGQWDEDIKSQVSDMAGKSMKDLYNGLQDDNAKTDFVKNVAGPAFKAQLGIDNIPYKELHGILAGGAGAEEDAQAAQGAEQEQGMEPAPQEDPAMGGEQQLQQSRY